MKKIMPDTLAGGLIVFVWQTLSWTALNLHGKEYRKTPASNILLNQLRAPLKKIGQYMLPQTALQASFEEVPKGQQI